MKAPKVPARIEKQEAAEAFLDFMASPEERRMYGSKAELARKMDISRDRLYQWQKEPWFQNALRHRVLSDLSEHRADVAKALAKEAKDERNVKAIQLFFELLGDHVHQVDVTSGGEALSEEDARSKTTDELLEALIEEKMESGDIPKQLDDADISKDALKGLLLEIVES